MKLKLLAFLLLAVSGLFAQKLPEAPQDHRFLDKQNVVALGLSGVAIGADMYSTQHYFNYDQRYLLNPHLWALVVPYEGNPVARLYGKSRVGSATYGLTAFGTEVAGVYFCHRMERHHGKKWHYAERAIPYIVTAVEIGYVKRNYDRIRPYTNLPIYTGK